MTATVHETLKKISMFLVLYYCSGNGTFSVLVVLQLEEDHRK